MVRENAGNRKTKTLKKGPTSGRQSTEEMTRNIHRFRKKQPPHVTADKKETHGHILRV